MSEVKVNRLTGLTTNTPVLPVGTLLVGYDFTHGEDLFLLTVGVKRENESLEIVNAFQGENAKALFEMLTTKNRMQEDGSDANEGNGNQKK